MNAKGIYICLADHTGSLYIQGLQIQGLQILTQVVFNNYKNITGEGTSLYFVPRLKVLCLQGRKFSNIENIEIFSDKYIS